MTAPDKPPYPMIDRPLQLPDGSVVQLYNLSVFAAHDGSRALSMLYGTSIPTTDRDALVVEAESVANHFADFAAKQGIERANVQICRTRAQAEMREAVEEILPLARTAAGRWEVTENGDQPPSFPAAPQRP